MDNMSKLLTAIENEGYAFKREENTIKLDPSDPWGGSSSSFDGIVTLYQNGMIDYEDQNGTHSCLDVDEFMSFYRHLMNVGWDRL